MALVSIPFTFTVGAVIVASQHNSNFTTIYSDYNGNITNDNLSASAAIADSKLAQITTAGKVSGAALITLGSIPSGAGTIPAKNGGTGGDLSAALIGATPYFSATGVMSALGAGTAGQVLSSGGAGAPTWSNLFGSWVQKTINTIYQAATDGIVVAYMQVDNGDDFTLLTDSAATPTTIRQRLATGSGTTAFSGSMMSPVKKNEYYQVKIVSGAVGTSDMYFISLGS